MVLATLNALYVRAAPSPRHWQLQSSPSALCLTGRLHWVPLRHAMQASHDAAALFRSATFRTKAWLGRKHDPQGTESEAISDLDFVRATNLGCIKVR